MFAIIIINFNKALDTVECLDSVLAINNQDFRIYLVDNGSAPADADLLAAYAQAHHNIEFFRNDTNLGFAEGNNRILELLLADDAIDQVVFLNNDTVVTADFLAALHAQLDPARRVEMVAARMLRYADHQQIDNLGITLYRSGLASNRKCPDDPLLGPTGGCALYTKRLLADLKASTGELYDSRFFCYAEDTDLALRALHLGYRAAYAEAALVYHKGSLSSGGAHNPFIFYHGIRNSLFALLKNMPLGLFGKYLPWIVVMHLAIVFRHCRKGQFAVTFRLYRDFLRGVPFMWKKRQRILGGRRLTNRELDGYIARSFYERGYVRFALRDLFRASVRSPDRR